MADLPELDQVRADWAANPRDAGAAARLAVVACARDGLTLAVAESLTGGLVTAALTAVPGASAVVRGGVVSYATDVKRDLLGVDADLLGREGAVAAEVAAQMAGGVRSLLGADVGLACTGVAGPAAQDGAPVGTVFVALARGDGPARVEELALPGDRAGVRAGTVLALVRLLVDVLPPAAEAVSS